MKISLTSRVLHGTLTALSVAFLGGGLVSLQGCQSGASGKELTLNIGHQKADMFSLLQARGTLEKDLAPLHVKVSWNEFQAGAPLLEALSVGSLDVGSTGESPPIFAQAAGAPLVYLASIPLTSDTGKGQALLVPTNSPVQKLEDLKGKKIAVMRASGAHSFLVQVLDQHGIKLSDVDIVYLPPADARLALESHQIDAWAIWEPYLTIAKEKGNARQIIDGRDILAPGNFYLARSAYAKEHPEILKILLKDLDETGVWSSKNNDAAAQLLADKTGIPFSTLKNIQGKLKKADHNVAVQPIDAKVQEAQQKVADIYFRLGLLPKRVDVTQAMLTPAQYAELIPNAGKDSAGSVAVAKK